MCDDDFNEDVFGDEESFGEDIENTDFEDEQCDYDEDAEYVVLSEVIENEILPGSEDLAETIIVGSMIVGNAYEEAFDEKERLALLRLQDKRKK